MANILMIAHPGPDGLLPKGALETLSAARELVEKLPGSELIVGLIGEDPQAAANAIAGCGAQRCIAVAGPEFGVSRYATDAAAVAALVREANAELVLAPATSRLNRALPGAAHRVGGRVDSHISGLQVEGETLHAQRWFYRQRMIATISRSSRPWFLLVDSGVFPAWAGDSGSADLETLSVEAPPTRSRVTGTEAPSSDAQTIRPDADLLFVAGAGWTKKQKDGQEHIGEAGKLIQGFLAKSQASLGSSKSLVDLQSEGQETLSFMSHLNQVGQTGSTPRHPRGLSTCCHGEEPHVVGWRFINERRAINLDANCGWAQGKADVLYIADAFEVMAKVNDRLG